MKTIRLIAAATLIFATNTWAVAPLVYLSCDLPGEEGKPPTHFDLTLDEQNSTVTFFVEKTQTINANKAVFGPTSVTWVAELPMGVTLTRAISRVDLSFAEDLKIDTKNFHKIGHCSVTKTPARQF